MRPRADGTVTFDVKLPGPGTAGVVETAWKDNVATASRLRQPAAQRFVVARAHLRIRHRGTVNVTVTASGHGRYLITHHRYKVTLRLWVSYTPTGGKQRNNGRYGIHLSG